MQNARRNTIYSISTDGSTLTIYQNAQITEMDELKSLIHTKNISSLIIENGVTIDEGVFSRCSSLDTLHIGDNVTIGEDAFTSCSDLTSLTIGRNVTIGQYAFERCSKLTDPVFSKGVIIGKSSFSRCANLKKLTFMAGTSVNDTVSAMSTALASVVIPDNAQITSMSFEHCRALSSIHYSPAAYIPDAAWKKIPATCTIVREELSLFSKITKGLKQLSQKEKCFTAYLLMVANRWRTSENKPQVPFEILTHIISKSQLCIPQVTTTAEGTQPLALTALQKDTVAAYRKNTASLEQYDLSLFLAPSS